MPTRSESTDGVVRFRSYQRASFRLTYARLLRMCPGIRLLAPKDQRAILRRVARVWRRQAGKSFQLGNEALDWMMESICLTTIISAAIALGEELLIKEAEAWRNLLGLLKKAAAANNLRLETNADGIDFDGFCDLFEHSKIEAKLWHDRTACSRTRVIAPNPNTAVGWTGHIIGDEFGRWPNCKDVLEAIEPFMESNPQFRLRLATTPPPDDTHYSFEMLMPPAGMEFEAKAEGNFYVSDLGLLVHRVDAWDAAASGISMHHPDTGEKITPDEHRALAPDKTAWDRNYGLDFVFGGTAAVGLLVLQRAMALGHGQCVARDITEEVTL
ncbi:hypothetical protein ASA1KI_20830 [Opitutales bacterium ASA1]|uniref:hypothetical protein n=1 Tax=Congregicoccus parvus TaxID=3081749 RepID=UPI002B325779|nr:hypothetical protein ASA1KI_20830 [Opitutales bacterium ASA1]